jgi:hypothetical protein
MPATDVSALPALGDAVTLRCARGRRRLVMTEATDTESGLLGAARRTD